MLVAVGVSEVAQLVVWAVHVGELQLTLGGSLCAAPHWGGGGGGGGEGGVMAQHEYGGNRTQHSYNIRHTGTYMYLCVHICKLPLTGAKIHQSLI